MKKFIYCLLSLLVGLWAVDRVGGAAMQWINRNTKDVLGPKFKYIQEELHEDVVFIGASRCHHHYVSSIIADTLGMSVYNCGIQGSDNIYSHYMTLCLVLARHQPKVVCVEMMASDFNVQEDPYAKLSYFAPYCGYDDSADSLFRMAGLYWKYKVSHLYRYNAKAASNIAGIFVSRQEHDDHGYLPVKKSSVKMGDLTKVNSDTDFDKQKLHYLHLLAERCRREGIALVFVVSPRYTVVDTSYYSILKEVAKNEKIPFLDYHTPGLYLDHPELFRDATHLNDEGARLYSSVFSSDLKKVLQEMKEDQQGDG